ncbi:hypothetical protein C464_12820 [Halorubrum coriense DSM 10284]|uniref:DUF7260 domain-containing protein n=1 Tax=Halorubrum coriense DSM 10284 TaxID=1227466 RepID=M0EFE4_9EURY|nr:hypothetical protein C464_12820 [Halorubrum coriense DSM 10284]
MSVDTHIEQAQSRVRAEQEAIDEKLDAYETFIRRVTKLETDQTPSSTAGLTTAGGVTRIATDASGPDRCRTVRTAFDETIRHTAL